MSTMVPFHATSGLAGVGRRSRGFTLVEVMIAGGLSVMAMGALFFLLLFVAREQQETVNRLAILRQADLLEEEITRMLRSMARSRGISYQGAPTLGDPAIWFGRIGMSRGTGEPVELLVFDDNELWHIPNSTDPGTQAPLTRGFSPTSPAFIEVVGFRPGMANDGSVDTSVVQVFLRVTDRGRTRRPGADPADPRTWIVIERFFTVQLRGV